MGDTAAAHADPAAEGAKHGRGDRVQADHVQSDHPAGQCGGAAVPGAVAHVPGSAARGRVVAHRRAQRGPRGDPVRAGQGADRAEGDAGRHGRPHHEKEVERCAAGRINVM